MNIKTIIETILLACPQSISNDLIRQIVDESLSNEEIKKNIDILNSEYKENKKGIYIDFISNGYQIRTHSEYHKYISLIKSRKQKYKLSNAALEVLSIIGFRQPISRLGIDFIRGVDSIGVIKKLLDNNLISIKKIKKDNRNQLFYITTDLFLDIFGLSSIEDLSSIKDIKEILK
tara:strand:+ start:1750 stop:2274 length:525 start_codon:yes stop_codon:yes gene_type:complete